MRCWDELRGCPTVDDVVDEEKRGHRAQSHRSEGIFYALGRTVGGGGFYSEELHEMSSYSKELVSEHLKGASEARFLLFSLF